MWAAYLGKAATCYGGDRTWRGLDMGMESRRAELADADTFRHQTPASLPSPLHACHCTPCTYAAVRGATFCPCLALPLFSVSDVSLLPAAFTVTLEGGRRKTCWRASLALAKNSCTCMRHIQHLSPFHASLAAYRSRTSSVRPAEYALRSFTLSAHAPAHSMRQHGRAPALGLRHFRLISRAFSNHRVFHQRRLVTRAKKQRPSITSGPANAVWSTVKTLAVCGDIRLRKAGRRTFSAFWRAHHLSLLSG